MVLEDTEPVLLVRLCHDAVLTY